MRPWTTRTLNAVVVAAGFATAGTGVASAAPATDAAMPDLTQVPDEVDFTVPLETCRNPGVPGREKAPCANVNLQASTPNTIKEVGKEIATTSHGVAGELRDQQPVLAPGEPNRLLGHVAGGLAEAERLVDTRPAVGVDVESRHTGVLNERGQDATLVKAQTGPLQPGHQGFSALDTGVDAAVAQGYSVEPMTSPVGDVMKVVESSPLQSSGAPVALPEPADVVPAAKQVPALASLDHGPVDTVRESAEKLLVQPMS